MISKFSEISIFGRVAYTIFSLEEYLKETGEKIQDWSILLETLWSFSNEQFADEYCYKIIEFMPECITEFDIYKNDDWEYLTYCEWKKLYNLYFSYKYTDTVNYIMNKIQEMISCHLYTANKPPAYSSLEIMEKNLLPFLRQKIKNLPDTEPFKIFSVYKDGCWDMTHKKEEIKLK